MTAASVLYDVTANNVANADTPDYAAQLATLSAQPGGGVAVTGITSAATPGVDLAQEMADMVLEGGLYAANARMLSAESDMWGSLFDAVA